ncbi:hypothetical protein H311_03487 [Anncaliia algerae PRA109]|nr:hypothetical protein H311_03487 [Anncaliia algerae PRA109]
MYSKEEIKNFLNEVTIDFFIVLKKYLYIFHTLCSFLVLLNYYIIRQNKIVIVQYKFLSTVYFLLLSLALMTYIKCIKEESLSTKDIFFDTDLECEQMELNINRFFYYEILEKIVPKNKTCEICNTYKPPRTHHCKRCNKCYPKFYHHCKIFNLCIEFIKFRFYYQFLFYNACLNFYSVALFSLNGFNNLQQIHLYIVYSVNCLVSLVVGVYSLYLFIISTFLILNNETTVEYNCLNAYIIGDNSLNDIFQEGPIKYQVSSRDRKYLNPYNINKVYNWEEVMGDTFFEWIFPLGIERGKGNKFKVNFVSKNEFV